MNQGEKGLTPCVASSHFFSGDHALHLNHRIQDLIDIPKLQSLLDSLHAAAGIPSAIIDLEGNILTGSGWLDICTKFHRVNARTKRDCIDSDKTINKGLSPSGGHSQITCPRGLTDIAAPLIIEGIHLANIFTGQFFIIPPDREQFRRQAAEFGFDEEDYLAAFDKVPVISQTKLDQYLSLITNLAESLAGQGLRELRSLKAQEALRERETQYRNLANSGLALIWTSGPDKLYNYFNKPWLNFTGRTLDQELGNGWTAGVHPEDFDRCVKTYAAAFDRRNSFDMEYRLRHHGGEYRWLQDVGTPNYNSSGEFMGYIGYCFDITERKRATQLLTESETRLQTLVQTIPDLIWLKDRDGTYLDCNPMFERFFGAAKKDIIGKTDYDFVDRELADFFREHDRKAMAAGRPNSNEEWIIFADDGHRALLDTIKTPMFDAQGKLVGVLGIARDITERRRSEEEKEKLQEQLNQAQKMEAIGILAGGIAHDFNNILGPIIGFADIAREDAPPGSQLAQDLEQILTAAHRAKDLVRQILAFSRHSAVERMAINIQPLVKESLKMLRASLPTTITIKENIHPQCGAVLASATQVYQIIMNLCTNAFHAMEKTGGVLLVGVNAVRLDSPLLLEAKQIKPGEYVELAISDTGIGIGPDIIDKIFDPYFTTKEIGKGTGLGLSVTHGIIKSYGGAITVESILGQGATFRVYIPVVTEEEARKAEEPGETPRGKERILFVDDEELLAELSKKMLERLGYSVISQCSSTEALAVFMADPDQFDLVITDQTMPGLTGTDLARRMLMIRPDLPIILCTGFSSVVSEESAKAIGIREFALKPFSKSSIGQLVRKLLDGGAAN
ncbi:MAG: PocR ligand-binding domain-containing protein [Deltaproteobacteria bacterium]|nr:PocR ligand-binding domain-containing protein [Deltaproteobacteria bacterium]